MALRIFLCQLSHEENKVFQNSIFPLGAGYVGAALKQYFKDLVEVEIFKSPIELNESLSSRPPDILMLGCYLWNMNLSIQAAKSFKEIHPNNPVILGGPNISTDKTEQYNFINAHPFIDAWILNSAEIPAIKIIKAYLENKSLNTIRTIIDQNIINSNRDNLLINHQNKNRLDTNLSTDGLHDIPSPY